MKPMRAVVLLSGGLDSTTMLAMAQVERGLDPEDILCLALGYGQRHVAELLASMNVAEFYGCRWMSRDLDPKVFASEESSLTSALEMPHLTYKEIAEGEGVSPTYVPFRNANLLSVATSIAMTVGATEVYFGAHAEDARGWAYPDCTPEFIGAMANAMFVGTYHKVRLVTPLEWLMKADIVGKGLALDAPYHLTMSCYEGLEPACGKCPTCVERLEAFRLNGEEDPIAYAKEGEPV
jgi:7-cyano-7-deazaguanine synthase